MNEDDKELFKLVFGYKTVTYILSGLGLIFFGWVPESPILISILFSMTGCMCIFLASYDGICYLKNKYLLGEFPIEK